MCSDRDRDSTTSPPRRLVSELAIVAKNHYSMGPCLTTWLSLYCVVCTVRRSILARGQQGTAARLVTPGLWCLRALLAGCSPCPNPTRRSSATTSWPSPGGVAPIKRVAKDFGESASHAGAAGCMPPTPRPDVKASESAGPRDDRGRVRLLEEENEVLTAAYFSRRTGGGLMYRP